MEEKKIYSTRQVTAQADVAINTLYRWLKDGKVPEPSRNRSGYRQWTEDDLKKVLEYANRKLPPKEYV